MKKCLILANGRPPKMEQVELLMINGYNTLICADGGADSALKLNLIPDLIIGDLDSISFQALDTFNDKSKIIRYTRQDDTDVEKCLKYAIENGFEEVILLGSTGDRLDHSFCNLGIVLKFFNKIKIRILHEESFLCAYNEDVVLKTIPEEIVSLYGFDHYTKITTTGLKYPLNNETLKFGERESTSNVATGELISLKITGGIIFVIRKFSDFLL